MTSWPPLVPLQLSYSYFSLLFMFFTSSLHHLLLFLYLHVNFCYADAGGVRVGTGAPILCVRPRMGILLPGENTSVLWAQVSPPASG